MNRKEFSDSAGRYVDGFIPVAGSAFIGAGLMLMGEVSLPAASVGAFNGTLVGSELLKSVVAMVRDRDLHIAAFGGSERFKIQDASSAAIQRKVT